MQSPSIPSRHIEDEQQKVFNDETDVFEEKEELLDSSNIQPEILPLESEYFIKAVKNYEEVTIKKRYKRILNFMDSLSALTVVVILVVGFWRGSWMLGDIYLVKVPLTVIIIAATSVHSILILSKDFCSKFSDKTKRTISMTVFRRFHTFLYAEACVFTFKGCWGVLDAFYGITFLPDTRIGSCGKPLLAWSVSTASFVGLLVLKCFNNSLGPPFAISVDDRDTSFNFPTMFKTKCTFVVKSSLGVQQNFAHFDKLRNRFSKAAKLINEVVSVEEQPLMEFSYLNENEILTSKQPYTEEFRNPYLPTDDVYQLSPRPFVNGAKGEIPYRIQSIEFPQISVYQKIPPKSFENILAHITAFHKRKEIEKLRRKLPEEMLDEVIYRMPISPMLNNKFNLLKPDDPKAINMLSLSHNRFNNFDPEIDEYNGEIVKNRLRKKKKPMEVVMSIYTNPMEWRFPTFTNFHKENVEPFLNNENLKKAVLHMAIYPEGGSSNSLQEIVV